jgi:hypothetical protein
MDADLSLALRAYLAPQRVSADLGSAMICGKSPYCSQTSQHGQLGEKGVFVDCRPGLKGRRGSHVTIRAFIAAVSGSP